jgi:hypothetical protein
MCRLFNDFQFSYFTALNLKRLTFWFPNYQKVAFHFLLSLIFFTFTEVPKKLRDMGIKKFEDFQKRINLSIQFAHNSV